MGDFGHRRFLFYESFKLYVLPAHPLQRSRLLRTIFRGLGSQRQAVHKSRHVSGDPLQRIQVGSKEVQRLRWAGTLLGGGGARHHPHVCKRHNRKSQVERGRKQQTEDQQGSKPPGRPTLLQAAAASATHDSNEPLQQHEASAASATQGSREPQQQQAGTAAAPAASPSSGRQPPSQQHPVCSPRASAAWRTQLWAGLTHSSSTPPSQAPHAPHPQRSKLSSNSPFQLTPPLASHRQSPSAHAVAAPAPAPTLTRSQQLSTSIFPTTPLSPAAQEVMLTADTLLARAKQLNSRFPTAPIHSVGEGRGGSVEGAAPHTPHPPHFLSQSSTPGTRSLQRQQHQHQYGHQHRQQSAQSALRATHQLTPPFHQTQRSSNPPPVTSTSTLAHKEAQIAALVLGAVDPLLENAAALANILEEQAAARGAAVVMKAPAHRPSLHECHQPATPVPGVKGTIPAGSDEQGTPVYEADRGSSAAHQRLWASEVEGTGYAVSEEPGTPVYEAGRGSSAAHQGLRASEVERTGYAGSKEPGTPVYEAGRGSSEAHQGLWASSVLVQRGSKGVKTAMPQYSPGRSAVRPLPEHEEQTAVRNDIRRSVGSHGRSSRIAGFDSSHVRGSKSAGADSVFSWRQRVGWEEGGPRAGPLAGGSARRRLDLEGLPYGMRLGNAPAVGVGAPGGGAGGGPGLQALTNTDQGDSSCSCQPSEWPPPQEGTSQGPEASATHTPTCSLQSKFVGGQRGAWAAAAKKSHALGHPGDTAEAQVWVLARASSGPRQSRTRTSQSGRASSTSPSNPAWAHLREQCSPRQSGMSTSGSVRGRKTSSSTRVRREVQLQQRGQEGAAKAHILLGMELCTASGRRSCRTSEVRLGSCSRHVSRKGLRHRFMRPTIAAVIKCQAAHPAARPSWKGQQAVLMRRAAGLSPSAPIAARRYRQPASLICRRLQ